MKKHIKEGPALLLQIITFRGSPLSPRVFFWQLGASLSLTGGEVLSWRYCRLKILRNEEMIQKTKKLRSEAILLRYLFHIEVFFQCAILFAFIG